MRRWVYGDDWGGEEGSLGRGWMDGWIDKGAVLRSILWVEGWGGRLTGCNRDGCVVGRYGRLKRQRRDVSNGARAEGVRFRAMRVGFKRKFEMDTFYINSTIYRIPEPV